MLKIYSIDYKKYPFLASFKDVIESRWPGLSLEDFLRSKTSVIYERAITIIKESINSENISYAYHITTEEEVVAFYLALLIISLIGNKWLRNRFAVAYGKHVYEYLKKESPENIEAIARKIGIDAKYDPNKCPKIPLLKRNTLVYKIIPFNINVKDYLRYVKRLANDPKYALINQIVDEGRVYVDKDVFVRILVEAIVEFIKNKIVFVDKIPDEIKKIVDEIVKELKLNELSDRISIYETHITEKQSSGNVKELEISKVPIDFNAFPPCMKDLVEQLKRGENLSHQARFTIAAFLSRIGMSVDSILELFSNVPDFNEKIARYQVEHIAGLRGSRKQYMPYSCSTMKSLGLCPLTEGDCGVRNPLTAYLKNIRRRRRTERKGKTNNKEQ